MGTLREYLADKGHALAERLARIARGEAVPVKLRARVSAEGRSGVRRIRIREHQVLSDSAPEFAGFDLGPSSPELLLGVLGSCLTHIVLIQAAERQLIVDAVEVDVTAVIDPRAGRPGHEQVPVAPQDIACKVHITSPAPEPDLQALYRAVEASCPILQLLRQPQAVRADFVRVIPAAMAEEAYALAT